MAVVSCPDCKLPNTLDKPHCPSPSCTWRRCSHDGRIVDPYSGRHMTSTWAKPDCDTPEPEHG